MKFYKVIDFCFTVCSFGVRTNCFEQKTKLTSLGLACWKGHPYEFLGELPLSKKDKAFPVLVLNVSTFA